MILLPVYNSCSTIFRVAVSREGSDIRIISEPLDGPVVFLVEEESL
jgi:hypothetical protein